MGSEYDAEIAATEAALEGVLGELGPELVTTAADIAGIVDPTPVSDAVGMAGSLYQGDYFGAGLSALSMLPYLGDALGKPVKLARTAQRITAMYKKVAALLTKLKSLLKKAGRFGSAVSRKAEQLLEKLKALRKKIDEFLGKKCKDCEGGTKKKPDPDAKMAKAIAERKETAREFYRKQGWDDARIDSHLEGIDFSQPVEVVTLPEGTVLEQWQVPGGSQGSYYSLPGSKPTELGISGVGQGIDGSAVSKVPSRFVVGKDAEVLKSTAKGVDDFWSFPGATGVTKGGGTQFFSPSKGLFKRGK